MADAAAARRPRARQPRDVGRAACAPLCLAARRSVRGAPARARARAVLCAGGCGACASGASPWPCAHSHTHTHTTARSCPLMSTARSCALVCCRWRVDEGRAEGAGGARCALSMVGC